MKNLIEKHLQKLEKPFNEEWICNFHSLIKVFYDHSLILKHIHEFEKNKLKELDPAVRSLEKLFKKVEISLQKTLKVAKSMPNIDKEIQVDISKISSYQISLTEIKNTSFDIRIFFSDYCFLLNNLAQKLINFEKSDLIFTFFENVSTHRHHRVLEKQYIFSDILNETQNKIDLFINKKNISMWGKWDLVLELIEWTKNGIPNQEFGKNLTNVFNYYKFADAVQAIGLYFLEQLSCENILKNLSVKAFELYLDDNNFYWIIVHYNEEYDSKTPYCIKKITSKPLLTFLKELLNASNYTLLERTNKTSHLLNELMIKKELLKVFYPSSKKFAGAHVYLASLGLSIDTQIIIDELAKHQSKRKSIPSFDYRQYFSKKVVVV